MSEAKWYVVHTYSGYENKVKANIDKTIENRHLEDQILEVRVPLEDVVEMKNGVQKVSQKKMFPGYVLIHMIMNDDTWYVVRNTRGVTGFVGPGSKPVPLTDAEMAVGSIYHKTAIKNDENGTEAAAVTMMLMEAMALLPEDDIVEMNMDHPFYFTISNTETGLKLFEGCVYNLK